MRISWRSRAKIYLPAFLLSMLIVLMSAGQVRAQDKPGATSAPVQLTKTVGVIKSIQPDSITVSAESGGEVTAKFIVTTKILRVPPGEKDPQNFTPLQPQELQSGDRVLVRGQASPNGDAHTMTALVVIVMKQADVAAKKQHDLEDWQKRGVDGVVTAVDATTGVITIKSGVIGANKNIAIHVAENTILRRYAPGSVQFDDAKPAPPGQGMAQIKKDDQLRARGTRSSDGNELTAQEIVSGSFPYIEGLIKATDATASTITVQDVISKTAVVVKVSPDSQMWKLSAEMAQRMAARLKGTGNGATGDHQSGAPGQGQSQDQSQSQSTAMSGQGAAPSAAGQRGPGAGPGGNGAPDLQRMLSHAPIIKLGDLQKGDAVVILATGGGDSDTVAIKLVAGVEAILTAAPNRSASSLLSPWSLGAQGGEGEGAQ